MPSSPIYPKPHSINNIDYYRFKAASLAEENHEVFVVAAFTFDTDETVVQISHHRDDDKSPMHIGQPKLVSAGCYARFGLGIYLKQDFNVGYRIRHAGMDISKGPIGLSQLYTVRLIYIS